MTMPYTSRKRTISQQMADNVHVMCSKRWRVRLQGGKHVESGRETQWEVTSVSQGFHGYPWSPFHGATPLEFVYCIWNTVALTRIPWRCVIMGSWECFSFSLTLPYYSELMSHLKVIRVKTGECQEWWRKLIFSCVPSHPQ